MAVQGSDEVVLAAHVAVQDRTIFRAGREHPSCTPGEGANPPLMTLKLTDHLGLGRVPYLHHTRVCPDCQVLPRTCPLYRCDGVAGGPEILELGDL